MDRLRRRRPNSWSTRSRFALWRPPLVLEPSPPKRFYGRALAATIGGQPVGKPLPVPVVLAG
jgi:hypothetical protein